MKEIWRDITGYEEYYQVSNYGRVRSLNRVVGCKRIKGQFIRGYINDDGYRQVGLRKDGERKFYRVHRLVAIEFIENPNSYLEVNHKDEVKLNNHVDNLEWCNHEYNNNYGTKKERMSKKMQGNQNNAEYRKKVRCLNTGEVFESILAASKHHKSARRSGISCCCNGNRKTCGSLSDGTRLSWSFVI